MWEVEMTTVSRSQMVTTRNAGNGLAVGRQVFRSHLVQTSEHLEADSEPNDVGLQEHDKRGEQHSQKDNRTPSLLPNSVHRYD